VVETLDAGDLDVDEDEAHPLGVVDRPLAVHGPTHLLTLVL
jgi:hypothetical protein